MKLRYLVPSGLTAALAITLCIAAVTPRPTPGDNWRVVVTRPIVTTGWKAGEEFRDDERLTAAFNELERQGFDPVFVQPIEEGRLDGNGDQRLVIAARSR